MIMYLNEFKKLFAESRLSQIFSPIPCTKEQVLFLESKLDITLPAAYKEFLLWNGNNPNILEFSDCHYGDLLDFPECRNDGLFVLKEALIAQLEIDIFPFTLPEDTFVFAMHIDIYPLILPQDAFVSVMPEGYQWMFFIVSEGEDPPVYYYFERQKKPSFTQLYKSFSECLIKSLEFMKNLSNQESSTDVKKRERFLNFYKKYDYFTDFLQDNFGFFHYISQKQAILNYLKDASISSYGEVIKQGKLILSLEPFPDEEIKAIIETKDFFQDIQQAGIWLTKIIENLEIIGENWFNFWEQYPKLKFFLRLYFNVRYLNGFSYEFYRQPDIYKQQSIKHYLNISPKLLRNQVINEGKQFLLLNPFPYQKLENLLLRQNFFTNTQEAKAWLTDIIDSLEIANQIHNDFWTPYSELENLLKTYFFRHKFPSAKETIEDYIKDTPKSRRIQAIKEGKQFLSLQSFPYEQIKAFNTYWKYHLFTNTQEAFLGLTELINTLEKVDNNHSE